MNASGKFSDLSIDAGLRSASYLALEVDLARCKLLGLEIKDIFDTLQVYLGSNYINDFNHFGRSWQLNLELDPQLRSRSTEILQLQVKNNQNQMVRLASVMSVRVTTGPNVIERHNMSPITRISANLNKRTTLTEAKSLCENLFEQELGRKKLFEQELGRKQILVWTPNKP